jgi:hypothetical protein
MHTYSFAEVNVLPMDMISLHDTGKDDLGREDSVIASWRCSTGSHFDGQLARILDLITLRALHSLDPSHGLRQQL